MEFPVANTNFATMSQVLEQDRSTSTYDILDYYFTIYSTMSRAVEQDRSSGEREQRDEADGDQASKSEHLELISNWNCFAFFIRPAVVLLCSLSLFYIF